MSVDQGLAMMNAVVRLVLIAMVSVHLPTFAKDACTENKEKTRKMLEELATEVSCANDANSALCASEMGLGDTAPAVGGAMWASMSEAPNIPGPNMATSDPARAGRDQMFRDYVKSMGPGSAKNVSYEQLARVAEGKNVVVLGGYSGAGYQNPEELKKYIRRIVSMSGPDTLFVIGGTGDGIGEAYKWIPEIAKELEMKNIETAGIVSRNAAKYGIAKQDYVVFVDTPVDGDKAWEVMDGDRSLMVKFAEDTHGQMAYFGGGPVSKRELEEAILHQVPATLIQDEALGPRMDKASKAVLAEHPGMSTTSSEFQDFLNRKLRSLNATSSLTNVGSIGGRFQTGTTAEEFGRAISRQSEHLFESGRLGETSARALLRSIVLKRGARLAAAAALTGAAALAAGIYEAVGYLSEATPLGCAGTYDFLVDMEPETCKPIKALTPKVVEFLQRDFTEQLKEFEDRKGLCEFISDVYANSKKPKIKTAECTSDGFNVPNGIRVKAENGKISEISGLMQNTRFYSTVEKVSYGQDGSPSEVCFSGAFGGKCGDRFQIKGDLESVDFGIQNSSGGLESQYLATARQYASYNSNLVEILSCCRPSSGGPTKERCAEYGISLGADSSKSATDRGIH